MDHQRLSCIRYSLIGFNIVFMGFGILILVFTHIGFKNSESLFSVMFEITSGVNTVRKCFIVNSFVLMFNSILGLSSIVQKKLSFLFIFCFVLFGLFIFTLFSILLGAINVSSIRQYNNDIINSYTHLLKQYNWHNSDNNNNTSNIVDNFQREFDCCGAANGSISWQLLRPKDVPLGAYPSSCCHDDHNEELINLWCGEEQVSHKVSCLDVISEELESLFRSLETITGLLIEVAIIEFLCILCICMFRSEPIERNTSINALI